jgi:AAA family ATP:ADP antiporter
MNTETSTNISLQKTLGLCFLAALLLASYALVRPASESIFVEVHGSKSMMNVWILVAICVSVIVPVFSRLSAGKNLVRVFAMVCIVSAALLAIILLLLDRDVPGIHYALYVWKDIYIIVLVETFWSLANVVFEIKSAKKTYGLFCASGAIGGFFGNSFTEAFAEQLGSSNIIWLTVGLLILVGILTIPLARGLGAANKTEDSKSVSFLEGFDVIKKSSYLLWILALIATTQIVINFIDFQYIQFLELSYPATDARTAMSAKIYKFIDIGSLSLQLLTAFILRYFGIPLTLLAIPAILGISAVSFLIAPSFAVVASTKIIGKVMDYSVFRAAKEILYIPLSYTEKTLGKAVIDMMTYRVAKGLSAIILTVIGVQAANSVLSPLILLLVLGWLGITVVIVRRYQEAEAKQKYQGT